MSAAKHTPGPWEAVTECPGQCCWFVQPIGNEQGSWNYIAQGEASEADARLIAAAPELLAAAEEVLDECADLIATDAGRALQDAINKARGEA